jgi:hypothetical protein
MGQSGRGLTAPDGGEAYGAEQVIELGDISGGEFIQLIYESGPSVGGLVVGQVVSADGQEVDAVTPGEFVAGG